MENILKKLLQGDSAVIREGTKELREALKNPEAIGCLCETLCRGEEPQIRQYAAVVLRKRLVKSKHWNLLNINARDQVKTILLERLLNEVEKSVMNSIVQTMGTIVKHELPATSWPELFQFLQHTTTSVVVNERELGFYTLSILLEIAPAQFFPHATSFIYLFSNTLNSLPDPASPISYFIILCMMYLSPVVRNSRELSNMYVVMIPRIITCIKAMAGKRPDRAVEAMYFFYDLAEPTSGPPPSVSGVGGGEGGGGSAVGAQFFFVPKVLKPVIKMALEFVQDKNNTEDLQMKSLNFICTLVGLKIKALEKNELLNPILATLFQVMSLPPFSEDDEDEEYFASDSDDDTMLTCASETLDTMAMNIKPQLLFPPLMELVEPALIGSDPFRKRAAYLVLGILAQGCEEYIKLNSLGQLVELIYKGSVEPAPIIRNAALFALGQFTEHLQPEISQYSNELMPLIVKLVNDIVTRGGVVIGKGNKSTTTTTTGVDRVIYAVEKFAETLEESLAPYAPQLVENLLTLTSSQYPLHTREMAISTIGSIATAIKAGVLPYFGEIMRKLNVFLTQEYNSETSSLQVESIDALGAMARALGPEHFRPYAGEAIDLGVRLLTTTEDPDIRKSVYGLLASVSTVMKEEMAPVLPTIVAHIIKSIKSDEGFVNHFKDEEEDAFPVYDSDQEDEDDDQNDGGEGEDFLDFSGFGVENDFIEEKEESCFAIKELAANTGTAFAPYLQTSFEEVFKLMSFPNEDVRRAAIEAEFQIVTSVAKIETAEGEQVFQELVERLIAKAALLVRVDEDRDVVLTTLECFQEALKELKGRFLSRSSGYEAIINCIKDVVSSRTEAQGWGEEGGAEDEELMEAAGDLVPALGKAMSQQEFASHFSILLPLFRDRMYNAGSDDENCRASGVGMLAECMSGLGPCIAPHINALLPFLLCLTADSSAYVRNNAIYAIGEMAYHGKQVLFPHYPDILNALSKTLPNEKNGKVLDNICGAIARLILVNTAGVPVDQVLPVLIASMPLREDYIENKYIFGCFSHLYSLGDRVLLQHLVPVIRLAAVTIQDATIDNETKEVAVNLVKMCRRDFPNDCQAAVSRLPPETLSALEEACAN